MPRQFAGALNVIERDDAVLIPGEPPNADFRAVNVILDDGVSEDDINSDQIVMLESPDNGTIRFTRGSAATWDSDFERWAKEGWMTIGFEAVRFYKSTAEFLQADGE